MYIKVSPTTTVTVQNHADLLRQWRSLRPTGADMLVGQFVVLQPLTARQIGRLPQELRAKLAAFSVEDLERLFELPDTRA
ncbi:MAG TPA: hypothetical protein VGC07_03825 [Granulicella sp.]